MTWQLGSVLVLTVVLAVDSIAALSGHSWIAELSEGGCRIEGLQYS